MSKRVVAELNGKVVTYHGESARMKAAGHTVDLSQHLEHKRLVVEGTCSCANVDCGIARGMAQIYAAGLRAGLHAGGMLAEEV